MIKFTKTAPATYTAGRWTITRTYCWKLNLDGCEVMGYTTLAAAKAGAAEYAANMIADLEPIK